MRADLVRSTAMYRSEIEHQLSGASKGAASVGRDEAVTGDVQGSAVSEPVAGETIERGARIIEGAGGDLRSGLHDGCAHALAVDDGDVFPLVHGDSPMSDSILPLDAALMDVRNYASEHGLTPGQVKDCFLAGVYASRILGAGTLVPSKDWQGDRAPEGEAA